MIYTEGKILIRVNGNVVIVKATTPEDDIYRMGRLWFSYLESDFIPSTHIKKHKL